MNASEPPQRSDPIRALYFDSVETADLAAQLLFYLGAVLSLLALFVDKGAYPIAYNLVLIAFVLTVVAHFGIGQFSRLYLTPRAEDKRRKDFLTNAYEVNLTHERTVGYYNNDFTEPTKRIAAQVLENSLFSKTIAGRMVTTERIKAAAYAAVWLAALLNRNTDLGVVVAAAQAVFSEQILSRWLRLEWLRMRFEKTYDDVYTLFQSQPSAAKFAAQTLHSLTLYETSKATAAITLSSRIFEEVNSAVTIEWQHVKKALGI